MAEYWMGVVQDKDYGHELLATTTQASVGEILESAGLLDVPFDYVSLGPGAGEFDRTFVRHLAEQAQLNSYYPVDISMDLLQFAVANVQQEFVKANLTPPRMRAFVADFEEGLEDFSVYMLDERKALFALTGFTLGNSKEDRLLDAISSAMRQKDLILLDCRLHSRGNTPNLRMPQEDVEQLMKPYSSPAIHRFAFGPVQVASDFRIAMEDVTFMKHVYPQRESAVVGAINVMLECTDLYSTKPDRTRFLTKMGFNPSDSSDRMRLVRRSQPFKLAMVTFYDFDTLSTWFNNRDMKIKWSKNVDNLLGVFLLQKE